jgi:hypothetical protein
MKLTLDLWRSLQMEAKLREREPGTRLARLRPCHLLILLPLVVILYGAVLRFTFTVHYQGANDFYIPWRAMQAALWESRNPYGDDVTRDIQLSLFGRELGPGEHQFDFAYPLTLAPLLALYTLVPYQWAQPLWHATVHCLLLVGAFAWLRAVGPVRVSPIVAIVSAFWFLSLYPTARTFILGQLAVIVFATVALAIWALKRDRQVTAGVMLALSTIKPQLSFLIVPLLLFLAWTSGQRRVVLAFAGALASLLLFSLVLQPAWPLDFLQRLGAYDRYTGLGLPTDSPGVLAYLLRLPGLDQPLLSLGIGALLILPVLYVTWKRRHKPDWITLGTATLLVSSVVAPRTATTDQVLLLLPVLWLLDRLPRPIALAAAVALWLIPWVAFLATVRGDSEAQWLRLLLPSAVALLWVTTWFASRKWPDLQV